MTKFELIVVLRADLILETAGVVAVAVAAAVVAAVAAEIS